MSEQFPPEPSRVRRRRAIFWFVIVALMITVCDVVAMQILGDMTRLAVFLMIAALIGLRLLDWIGGRDVLGETRRSDDE